MADRKARSLTFKVPPGTNLGTLKQAIENENTNNEIRVFQEIGANEYLIELTSELQTQDIIENGFDAGSLHIRCHPPHGYYLNVSIMGLKAYISDDDVIEKLSNYGEIKGQVIRLKYKQDHELAGLENGNRLIRMVLTSPSISYSLNIGGEWCRVIHNNQLVICSHCDETGHSRKNCPTIECRNCKQLGHISFHCPLRVARHTETAETAGNDSNTTANDATTPDTNDENHTDMTMEESSEESDDQEDDEHEIPPENNITVDDTSNEERRNHPEEKPSPERSDETESSLESKTPPQTSTTQEQNTTATTSKRPHPTDSDSDPPPLPRRQKIKPKPNVNTTRRAKKNEDSTPKS